MGRETCVRHGDGLEPPVVRLGSKVKFGVMVAMVVMELPRSDARRLPVLYLLFPAVVTCRWEPHGGSQTLQERRAGHTQHCTISGGPNAHGVPSWSVSTAQDRSASQARQGQGANEHRAGRISGHTIAATCRRSSRCCSENASAMRTPCAFSRLGLARWSRRISRTP